jgi:LmbE family N-acetylglucosaminyl deacetylase
MNPEISQTFNIVFAVCHPDDEALWVGGLLYELSKFSAIRAYVVCLSGHDAQSPRESEFLEAKKIAGYRDGVVLGSKLRAALDPLKSIDETFEEGLRHLNLKTDGIDLLITHSPYGDEQKHPHHAQAHRELRSWARRTHVPFGFFSCLPIPFYLHQAILHTPKRLGSLQLLNFSKCSSSTRRLLKIIHHKDLKKYWRAPKYYLQFLTDLSVKLRMLGCYRSTKLDVFQAGYATFDNPCEALYILDDAGLAPFEYLFDRMEIPEHPDLFSIPSLPFRISNRIRRWRGELK